MSAFLGPIHHWLYHKIHVQNQMTEKFLNFADQANAATVREQVDSQYGCMPEGRLEDLIDEGNIHGWLQEKITLVENRHAMTVKLMLEQLPDSKNDLLQLAKDYGTEISTLSNDSTALQAYQLLTDTLIDGMPCDHVNVLLKQEENDVEWKRTRCLHTPCWEANGSDVKNYYEIRNQFIEGILFPTKLGLKELEEGCYRLMSK